MIAARALRFGFGLAAAVACGLLLVVAGTGGAAPARKPATQPTPLLDSPQGPPAHAAPAVSPLARTTPGPSTGQALPTCPAGVTTCYGPAQIKSAYSFPTDLDGSGQTIIVVTAFGSPTIQGDLRAFDQQFGLPDAPLVLSGPNGSSSGDPRDDLFWNAETTYEVEYAHAMAPRARLVLAVAASDGALQDFDNALLAVVPHYRGAVISQSVGADEADWVGTPTHLIFESSALQGDTAVASSGDTGPFSGDDPTSGAIAVEYPAADPLVTGVGGTMGNPTFLSPAGGYGSEQVWNELDAQIGASGGGISSIFPAPGYQSSLGLGGRAVPDVAAYAAFGEPLVFTFTGPGATSPGTWGVGGTSASVPIWAGIFALANQARQQAGEAPLGPANDALYAIFGSPAYSSDFHDITAGNNGGDAAGPGYDLATGLGTPIVSSLIPDLVRAAGSPYTGPGAAHVQDVTCQNQTLTGGPYHNVQVRSGASCTLQSAVVLGNVQANNAAGLQISGSSVAGNVQANNVTGGANLVCSSVIDGNLQIQGGGPRGGGSWSVGGQGCSADALGYTGNLVDGNLQFGSTSGSNDVSNNVVTGNLQCQGGGSLVSAGNEARQIQGACSGAQVSLGP